MFQAEFDKIIGSKSALSKAYLYNDCLEDDEFCLKIGDQEQDMSGFASVAMAQGLSLPALGGKGALL